MIIGGTPLSRVAMNITMRAVNLLSGKQPPTRMVKTTEEAYAFINEMRAAGSGKAANG